MYQTFIKVPKGAHHRPEKNGHSEPCKAVLVENHILAGFIASWRNWSKVDIIGHNVLTYVLTFAIYFC